MQIIIKIAKTIIPVIFYEFHVNQHYQSNTLKF